MIATLLYYLGYDTSEKRKVYEGSVKKAEKVRAGVEAWEKEIRMLKSGRDIINKNNGDIRRLIGAVVSWDEDGHGDGAGGHGEGKALWKRDWEEGSEYPIRGLQISWSVLENQSCDLAL